MAPHIELFASGAGLPQDGREERGGFRLPPPQTAGYKLSICARTAFLVPLGVTP